MENKIIITAILFLLASCNKQKQEDQYNKYFLSIENSNKVQAHVTTIKFDDNLFADVYAANGYLVVFSELTENNMTYSHGFFKDFLCLANIYNVYYDSLSYDLKCLREGEHKNLSASIKHYYLIRSKDSSFEDYYKDSKDLNELQKVINNLSYFRNFSIKDKKKLLVLKKIIVFTQLQLLLDYRTASMSDFMTQFDLSYYNEIENVQSFQEFKQNIIEKNSVIGDSEISILWTIQNKTFLKNYIDSIENDYLIENVFFVYNYYDYLVGKFVISNTDDGGLRIEKEILNKEFLRFSPNKGYPSCL